MPPLSVGDIIRFPQWEQPNALQSVEAWVDSAISSNNSVLNALLSPVRTFVHNVLHPIFWAGDVIIGAGYSVTKWAFSGLQNLAYEAIWAVNWTIDTARSLASQAYSDAINFGSFVSDQAHKYADLAIGSAVSTLRKLIDAVGSYTSTLIANVRSWAEQAIGYAVTQLQNAIGAASSYASALIGNLRTWSEQAIGYAVTALQSGLDNARRFLLDRIDNVRNLVGDGLAAVRKDGNDSLSAFYDDVIKPLASRVDHIVSDDFGWASDLLHLVAEAADWILWVSRHVAGDAVDLWAVARDWLDFDVDELVRTATSGVASAGAR